MNQRRPKDGVEEIASLSEGVTFGGIPLAIRHLWFVGPFLSLGLEKREVKDKGMTPSAMAAMPTCSPSSSLSSPPDIYSSSFAINAFGGTLFMKFLALGMKLVLFMSLPPFSILLLKGQSATSAHYLHN